jgi:GNAT superfamily N-acetyltransferase
MNFKRTDSRESDFLELVRQLDEYLADVDGSEHAYYAQFNGVDSIPNVIVAYDGETPVGCGAFKPYDANTVEIKRMYVRPESRGMRVGAMILRELETWANELGNDFTILETGHKQVAAVRLYQTSGYEVIPNYDQYAGVENSICMKKQIGRDITAAV